MARASTLVTSTNALMITSPLSNAQSVNCPRPGSRLMSLSVFCERAEPADDLERDASHTSNVRRLSQVRIQESGPSPRRSRYITKRTAISVAASSMAVSSTAGTRICRGDQGPQQQQQRQRQHERRFDQSDLDDTGAHPARLRRARNAARQRMQAVLAEDRAQDRAADGGHLQQRFAVGGGSQKVGDCAGAVANARSHRQVPVRVMDVSRVGSPGCEC